MTVLAVSHLSKYYAQQLRRSLWYGVADIARELVAARGDHRMREGEFRALDDVSFELARGEALAIVGQNGAGKTTLLKVLSGLLKPDAGEVRLHGSVGALLELGTGLHPLLTGNENIQLGSALRGLTKSQAAALHERVVDFAELGDFIDAPLQSYSAGMRARLAFALAAHLEPDILLVDEVLAVGDATFQRKCVNHIKAFLARGGALLLVSHNTHQVQSICERGLFLDRGRVAFRGTAVETLNHLFERRLGADGSAARVAAPPIGPVIIHDVLAEPLQSDTIRTGEPLRITVRYHADEPVDAMWGFGIWTADQWVCVLGQSDLRQRTLDRGDGELTCVIPKLPLVAGRYSLRGAIQDFATQRPLALYGWFDAPAILDVRADPGFLTNAQMALHQLVTVDVEWQ